jgi:peptidoglycan/LPS O-acetylase OafA/YrhL
VTARSRPPAQEGRLGSTLATARPTGRRRHDLDLIRMTIVVGLIFFHAALSFDPGDYYVDNGRPTTS